MVDKIKTTYSTKENSFSAGKEIGKKLASIDPESVFLFPSVRYDFQKLIEGILSQTETKISGCSSAGGICSAKLIEEGAVAIGFNSPSIKFGSGAARISKDPIKAGIDSVDSALKSLRRQNLTKILAKYYAAVINDPTQIILQSPGFGALTFIDGLSGAEEGVLEGIKQKFSMPLPLIGGSAGDDLRLKKTLQICNNKVCENSVVTTLLMTNERLGFAVKHGWIPRKQAVLATKVKGRVVYELNNRPAVNVYAEILGTTREKLINEKNIAFQTGLKHPLAALTMSGEYWLKHPKEVFKNGSISFFSEVPEGVALVTTDSTEDKLIEAGVDAVRQAIKDVGKAGTIFVFNCVARKALLGVRAGEEVKRISELTDAPIIGFYTYGEQALTQTTPICHRNQTISVLALGKG